MSAQEQQKQFALAALDFKIVKIEKQMGALLERLPPPDREAAQRWLDQSKELGEEATGTQLTRMLQRGRRLFNRLQKTAPPVAPALPGAPPAATRVPAQAMFAQIRTLREKARKCPLLPEDAAKLEALQTFVLKGRWAQRLVKLGYNPIDVAMMNPTQRKQLTKAPRKCYSETEREALLDTNPWSYTNRRQQCLPMDEGEGEFVTQEACKEARRNEAAESSIEKFIELAYGKAGVASNKQKIETWIQANPGASWQSLWTEFRDEGIPDITREETVMDEVYTNPAAQMQIAALEKKARALVPSMERNEIQEQADAIRRKNLPSLVPRAVYVPDEGRQREEALDFFKELTGTGARTRDEEMIDMRKQNASLRREIQNLKAGKITETEMEASQQRYLQGQVVTEHAPALQDLDVRVAKLEQAEQADASQIAALKKEWEDLLHKYSGDTSSLNELLQTQGTNKTYHDYIAQTIQEQIDAQTPSVGMQAQTVVQSAAFRRAMKRRKRA